MTEALLLDTHVLLWLERGSPFALDVLHSVEAASIANRLFASHMSIWELGVAVTKRQVQNRPDLGGLTPAEWFKKTTHRFNVRPLTISLRIAAEAARVPEVYGSGDPGDCFLIATARVRRLALVSRDDKMIKLSRREPDYLSVVPC